MKTERSLGVLVILVVAAAPWIAQAEDGVRLNRNRLRRSDAEESSPDKAVRPTARRSATAKARHAAAAEDPSLGSEELETVGWAQEPVLAEPLPEEGAYANGGSAGCGPACLDACCTPRWAHRSGIFGEFLYLRPRDAEVVYAAPVDGPVTPPGNPSQPGNQVGPLGMVDPDYEPAYRVGFTRACGDCTSLRASYTNFESSTTNAISAEPSDEPTSYVQSQVTHPGVQNAEDNWLEAQARLDIDFELADVDYRWLFAHSDCYAVNLLAGARYARLEQEFHSLFSVNGSRRMGTQIDFDGGGLRVGLEAERYAPCGGWMVYGRGVASFLAGEFRANYKQSSSFAETEIDTRWKAGRVVSILDLELGVGWTSRSGRLRLSSGYLFSAWFNTLETNQFIDAVNRNHFTGIGSDTITFDGLTARAEYRF